MAKPSNSYQEPMLSVGSSWTLGLPYLVWKDAFARIGPRGFGPCPLNAVTLGRSRSLAGPKAQSRGFWNSYSMIEDLASSESQELITSLKSFLILRPARLSMSLLIRAANAPCWVSLRGWSVCPRLDLTSACSLNGRYETMIDRRHLQSVWTAPL